MFFLNLIPVKALNDHVFCSILSTKVIKLWQEIISVITMKVIMVLITATAPTMKTEVFLTVSAIR